VTTEQRERLLGMLLLGASSVTACDVLGIAHSDLLATLDSDEPFRYAHLSACAQRDHLSRALERGTK
jgi:hypothetical protein